MKGRDVKVIQNNHRSYGITIDMQIGYMKKKLKNEWSG